MVVQSKGRPHRALDGIYEDVRHKDRDGNRDGDGCHTGFLNALQPGVCGWNSMLDMSALHKTGGLPTAGDLAREASRKTEKQDAQKSMIGTSIANTCSNFWGKIIAIPVR